jgi:hypothetical protein
MFITIRVGTSIRMVIVERLQDSRRDRRESVWLLSLRLHLSLPEYHPDEVTGEALMGREEHPALRFE